MAPKKSAAAKKRTPRPDKAPSGSQADPAVVAFLEKLSHPLKPAIESLRAIILGVSPAIQEGIKWNAPSFRTTEYFATMNLRGRDGADRVWLILHRGAKAKDNNRDIKVADPDGLLEWLSSDRALVTFTDASDVASKRAALESIVREWIAHQ